MHPALVRTRAQADWHTPWPIVPDHIHSGRQRCCILPLLLQLHLFLQWRGAALQCKASW
jgi:hypothetical protein